MNTLNTGEDFYLSEVEEDYLDEAEKCGLELVEFNSSGLPVFQCTSEEAFKKFEELGLRNPFETYDNE